MPTGVVNVLCLCPAIKTCNQLCHHADGHNHSDGHDQSLTLQMMENVFVETRSNKKQGAMAPGLQFYLKEDPVLLNIDMSSAFNVSVSLQPRNQSEKSHLKAQQSKEI